MKKNYRIFLLIILVILTIIYIKKEYFPQKSAFESIPQDTALQAAPSENTSDNIFYLPVVETTDIHGTIVDISSGDDATYQYRLAYIANEIDKLRENGDILLLDTGDSYQGNVISNKLDGQPITAYYDIMGYDAICLGNHEFDWQLETTLDEDGTLGSYDLSDTIKGDSDIPVICWDIYNTPAHQKINHTKDYVVVTKTVKSDDGQEKDINVAIFGYINDYSSSISKSAFNGYTINESEIDEVEAKAKELEANGEADISVLVCHVGPEEMNDLIETDSVIDLVVCGHTHQMDVGELTNGVTYLLGGSYGRSYATATLAISANNDVHIENADVIPISKSPERLYDTDNNITNFNEEILKLSKISLDNVNRNYPEVMLQLGRISNNISKDPLPGSIGEDIATNWAALQFAHVVDAQVGITNSTGVRGEIFLQSGERMHYVTGADIYTLFPFCNDIFKYELTYSELFTLCQQTKVNDNTYLGISGVTAYYTDGDHKKISKLSLGDKLIYDNGWLTNENSIVTVAVSDYIAAFDNLCFINHAPVNASQHAVDNVSIIEYLSKNYGPDREIPVETTPHLLIQ